MGSAQEPIVVKLGGRTQGDPALPSALAGLWRSSGGCLVIVHGGGDQISALQRMRGEEPLFVGGRRVTTPLVLELVRMVLSGAANKQLVSALTAAGVPAVGISGEDAALLPATPIDESTFGSSGTPGTVDPKLVQHLLSGGYLPVVSPVGTNLADTSHGALNINGDDAAAAIAVALGAKELLLMVDVEGVLDQPLCEFFARLGTIQVGGVNESRLHGLLHGVDHTSISMTQRVDRNSRNEVEITLSIRVDHVHAFAAHEERLLAFVRAHNCGSDSRSRHCRHGHSRVGCGHARRSRCRGYWRK